jgi:hypothetical protein
MFFVGPLLAHRLVRGLPFAQLIVHDPVAPAGMVRRQCALDLLPLWRAKRAVRILGRLLGSLIEAEGEDQRSALAPARDVLGNSAVK